jgi:hypothetical protein
MRMSGWVALRRGIVDHLVTGKLTPNEYFALVQLILLADASTGRGTINGPTLLFWTQHAFSLDTGERVLASLHQKRYIWYRPSRSKNAQPYWVNRYELSRGPERLRMTNLSQLFEKETICDADVLRLADHGGDHTSEHVTDDASDDGSDHASEETSDNNNTDPNPNTDQNTVQKQSPLLSVGMPSGTASLSTAGDAAACAAPISTGVMHSGNASMDASLTASSPTSLGTSQTGSRSRPATVSLPEPSRPLSPEGGIGIKKERLDEQQVGIAQPTYYETPYGLASTSPSEARLKWSGTRECFIDTYKHTPVSYDDAVRRLGIEPKLRGSALQEAQQ